MKRLARFGVSMLSFVAGSLLSVGWRARADQPPRQPQAADAPGTFYVATDGADESRGGSSRRPWASISYAAGRVPDGSTIVVAPGTYRGRVTLGRQYATGITIKSETPYRAMLRNRTDKVIRCYGCNGVTIQGFDIAHEGPGADPIVVQIDGDRGKGGQHIVLRDNVLHDSYRNDILKINNGARDILVTGNMFYNQASHDEHIDINSAVDITVEDNVFFNDYAGSGRPQPGDSASFIVIKDSNEDEDGILGAERITLRRNVFLGWQGGRAYGFVLVGEDGKPYVEARDVMVENNLFLGDSPMAMRSPFGIKGGAQTTFRNNTVVGNLPGKAFATRINREGENKKIEGIAFYNNVWDDPTGTMAHFSDALPEDVGSFTMSHNLFWNGGAGIPLSGNDAVNYTCDRERVVANPGLPDPREVAPPRWRPDKQAFADGSTNIAAVRSRLVDRYARPSMARAVMDKADPRNAPGDDIRGKKRGDRPDIGAFEVGDGPGRATLARRR
jgi:hypothetical protein